jgi:ABC-2 type transport system permease protein
MSFGKPLLATIYKELLLLARDRAGLLILFGMPAVLVLVITLVQENVMKKMGESPAAVILLDQDGGELAHQFAEVLRESGQLEIRREENEQAALAKVNGGSAQLCIIIRPGMTSRIQEQARRTVREKMNPATLPLQPAETGKIDLYFDPVVHGGFRSAMMASINMAAMAVQFEELLAALQVELSTSFGRLAMVAGPGHGMAGFPGFTLAGLSGQEMITVGEPSLAAGDENIVPNSVQQNVPAWALFGIFFIAVPLAGSMIRERLTGTLDRLLVMPVPFFVFLLGKVVAYGLVCLAQFALILAIGRFLLPILGAPVFETGGQYGAIFLVLLAVVAAATAYGILLGTVGRSYEQVSMFGSMSVVIAAALGGIMVPVHAMPEAMQWLSKFSPLGWGLEAMLKIFVRQAGFAAILLEIVLLFSFTMLAVAAAWGYFAQQEKSGRF